MYSLQKPEEKRKHTVEILIGIDPPPDTVNPQGIVLLLRFIRTVIVSYAIFVYRIAVGFKKKKKKK